MFILGPRSVRRFGADIFVAPWDLITPPGVMHYHFATRSRILCAGQALRHPGQLFWRELPDQGVIVDSDS